MFQVLGQPELHSKTLSQNKTKTNKQKSHDGGGLKMPHQMTAIVYPEKLTHKKPCGPEVTAASAGRDNPQSKMAKETHHMSGLDLTEKPLYQ